jgi:hypothetical protein
MANTSIFGLTATAALASNDVMVLVDVSDTAQGVNGSTRKATLATMAAYLNTSPALTGVPTAPTASPGTNSTQLATTAYADAIAALKANLASPALTGTPTGPTASQGTNTTQLATTAFVVAAVAALQANLGRRDTVRAASTANLTLSAPGASIDGVAMSAGQLFIAKNQSAPAENGVYQWNGAASAATRATEFDAYDEMPGALIAVQEGTANADTLWICTSNVGGTLNTTAVNFAQFSAAGALLAANNLSDLSNAATARTNLGLTALATTTPGTGVATFLATPTSANLRAAVTDEDGSGALLFAQSPSTLSANTNLVRATHGNRLIIADTGGVTLTVEDDTTGVWGAGDALYGTFTAASGTLTLAGDGTSTVTAGYGMSLVGYPGQEFSLFRVGTNAWRGGFPDLSLQQNSQSAAYTTVMGDRNKHILHPAADNNARTFTIDSNANVPYPIGTSITFVNEANVLTIAITSDTMRLAGAGTTGSRSLAANGIATALKVGATSWIINGTGLT